jgi:V/A-type H+/Na+-transporting ATPase subunit I
MRIKTCLRIHPGYSEAAAEALKFLADCPRKRQQITQGQPFDLDSIINQALTIKLRIRELTDLAEALDKRIKEIEPWGDFRLPNQADLGGLHLWFYIVPLGMLHHVKQSGLIWQVVHENNLNAYVVVISATEPEEQLMPVPRTHVGSIPLSQLRREYADTLLHLEDQQAERESLTRWIGLLSLHLCDVQNREELQQAQLLTYDKDHIFAVQGWVPVDQITAYQQFAESLGLAMLVDNPGPNDQPPTLLNNPLQVAGGQDLVNFYQTPGYRGWDPSAAVFFSFASFFAMILSDAGYAAVLAILLALKWRSLGDSLRGQRLRILALDTLALSIIWGVLLGSYFGYTPSAESGLYRLKLLDLNDFDSMMRISVAVGVFHIMLANLIKAYYQVSWTTRLVPIAWIAMVIGGFCYWLSIVTTFQAILESIGLSLLGFGIVLLLFFGSDRPVQSPATAFFRLFDGLKQLIGITQLFGDVLSYMRLFALGLASASLALTFNQLAMQVLHALPGPGLLFCILILLVGHALNLVLCLMSGVVHGLRLNFIEFYNWSVSDEGYPFKAFYKRGVHS